MIATDYSGDSQLLSDHKAHEYDFTSLDMENLSIIVVVSSLVMILVVSGGCLVNVIVRRFIAWRKCNRGQDIGNSRYFNSRYSIMMLRPI